MADDGRLIHRDQRMLRGALTVANHYTFEQLDAHTVQVLGGSSPYRVTAHPERPVFAAVAERRLQPDVFIGLTDLESVFPERAPAYPVLWVVPTEHGEAPWGRVVEVG